jgi:hypothetical protein
MRRIVILAAFVLSALCATAQQSAVTGSEQTSSCASSMSGKWHLDRDLTTADLRWNKLTDLVVEQSDGRVRLDYFDHDRPMGSETFITDNRERPRYTTRIERAYARARWAGHDLVVRTRSFLDLEGYQSFNEIDRWQLSDDGHTLKNLSSDGKALVFYRVSPSH